MELSNNLRILRNTIMLYGRLLFTTIIALYTTRVVLSILGAEDYGIYSVVGGVVALFTFLNNGLITASQRFISYEIGRSKSSSLMKTFSSIVLVHLVLSVIILLLLETVGLWFLNAKLNIPTMRMPAANLVYQASILTFLININSVPFSSSIVAHEKMDFYALVGIVDACLKLLIVYLLTIISFDKLAIYSVLLIIVSLINILLYYYYCKRNFAECHFAKVTDKKYFGRLLSFAGWSFLGNFGFTAKEYGVNIIVNIFCGAIINAAKGLAYQVSGVISSFVANFQMAMNPQIIKFYSSNDISSMMTLVNRGARYSFYLLSVITIPFTLRMDYVLSLWLVDVPSLTVEFLSLSLIMALINSMAGPLTTAMQASGRIKKFQIVISLIMLIDIPFSYLLLYCGFSPTSVMYVAIATALLGLFARVFLLHEVVCFAMRHFITNVILQNIFLFMVAYLPVHWVNSILPNNFGNFVAICCISVLWSGLVFLQLGTSKTEKTVLRNLVLEKVIHRLK